MPNDETTEQKDVAARVEGNLRRAGSYYEDLALDTLAALLKSDDEKVRLEAAQIILTRPKRGGPFAGVANLLKKR